MERQIVNDDFIGKFNSPIWFCLWSASNIWLALLKAKSNTRPAFKKGVEAIGANERTFKSVNSLHVFFDYAESIVNFLVYVHWKHFKYWSKNNLFKCKHARLYLCVQKCFVVISWMVAPWSTTINNMNLFLVGRLVNKDNYSLFKNEDNCKNIHNEQYLNKKQSPRPNATITLTIKHHVFLLYLRASYPQKFSLLGRLLTAHAAFLRNYFRPRFGLKTHSWKQYELQTNKTYYILLLR